MVDQAAGNMALEKFAHGRQFEAASATPKLRLKSPDRKLEGCRGAGRYRLKYSAGRGQQACRAAGPARCGFSRARPFNRGMPHSLRRNRGSNTFTFVVFF